MSGPRRAALARVLLLLAATAGLYAVGENWVRGGETTIALLALHGLGAAVTRGPGTSIVVTHSAGGIFTATLTPSCSAWASILAIACLTMAIPRVPPGSRLGAALVAAVVVFAGNIVRIDASIAVGLVAGPPSLVLFHNLAGSLFGFAYTLAGFVIVIMLLLPRRGARLDGPLPADPFGKDRADAPVTS